MNIPLCQSKLDRGALEKAQLSQDFQCVRVELFWALEISFPQYRLGSQLHLNSELLIPVPVADVQISALTFNRDLGAAMVSKCANPECSVSFRYFREGKLFRIDNEGLGTDLPTSPQVLARKRPHRVEHYWLCGTCAARLTLTYDRDKGVLITPMYRPAVRKAAAS